MPRIQPSLRDWCNSQCASPTLKRWASVAMSLRDKTPARSFGRLQYQRTSIHDDLRPLAAVSVCPRSWSIAYGAVRLPWRSCHSEELWISLMGKAKLW